MLRSDIAADWTTEARVTRSTGGDGYDKDVTGDLGDHEPVGRRVSRVVHRVALPYFADVIETEAGMLEEVRCLLVDLERVVVVELIEVQQIP